MGFISLDEQYHTCSAFWLSNSHVSVGSPDAMIGSGTVVLYESVMTTGVAAFPMKVVFSCIFTLNSRCKFRVIQRDLWNSRLLGLPKRLEH